MQFDQTPLLVAMQSSLSPQRDSIVKALLDHNANVNAADTIGTTPLMHAVMQPRPCGLVAMLLDKQAINANMVDAAGQNALMLAIEAAATMQVHDQNALAQDQDQQLMSELSAKCILSDIMARTRLDTKDEVRSN